MSENLGSVSIDSIQNEAKSIVHHIKEWSVRVDNPPSLHCVRHLYCGSWPFKQLAPSTSSDGSKVLFGALRVRLHGLVSWFPASWTHLIGVGLHVLQRLQHAKRLIYRATKRQVVDSRVLDHPFTVNNEQATECNAVSGQHTVGLRDLPLEVGDQWVIQVAQATIVTGGLDPCKMRELRVNRNAQNLGVDCFELVVTVTKCRDFRRAHESEIQWVKEENNVFALQNQCSISERRSILPKSREKAMSN